MHHHKSMFSRKRAKDGHGKKAHGHCHHDCGHIRGPSRKEGRRKHHKSDVIQLEHALFKGRRGLFYGLKMDASPMTDPVSDRKFGEDAGLKLSVDLKKCVRCGKCEQVCPTGAIRVDEEIFRVDPSLCNGCGRCVEGCPQTALFLRKNQEVFVNF